MSGATQIYIIALGSNQPRSRTRPPTRLVEEAIEALSIAPFRLLARSPIIETPPLGPSKRRYANAAIMVETAQFLPDTLLRHLKAMERAAGRRPGLRWSSRPLDLDIIAWGGGRWISPGLTVPHKEWSKRIFVLEPVCAIAPRWKDPKSGKSVRQMLATLKKPRKMRKGC
ncbi:MAG: 2-amino-4-hydroxy-6-hydroxymethyldihydropteridine diphosphokinase [Sphingobium sp.]|nr:2-amino-4-hydroxy-6-hydroxymethyldihydropteridine diphosphokinase [Sphingobium sp.]